MGSIRARNDSGLLFVDFRFRGERCREQTALPDNPGNRKRLEKLLAKIESAVAAGTFEYGSFFPSSKNAKKFAAEKLNASGRHATQGGAGADRNNADVGARVTPLFRDFAETWYREKEVEWRRSHKAIIRADLDKRLMPTFGDREVGQITKPEILGYRAQLAKQPARGKETVLSNRRINKILNPLRQILNEAAERFDFRTPFQGIKQLKSRRTDVDPFSLDEIRKILDAVRRDFCNYYTVRFFTGMRTGEIDGLKWKYVDFERRLILVRETIVLGEEEETKNEGSQRDIHMSQLVYDALKAQESATRHLSAFVFCNTKHEPLDHKNVTNRVWYPLLRHLGIKRRRPYQCRHTAATLWMSSGESPEWIAKQLGHTTTEMLFRVYSRFVPNLTRKDGSAFERLMAGVMGGGEKQIQENPATESTPKKT